MDWLILAGELLIAGALLFAGLSLRRWTAVRAQGAAEARAAAAEAERLRLLDLRLSVHGRLTHVWLAWQSCVRPEPDALLAAAAAAEEAKLLFGPDLGHDCSEVSGLLISLHRHKAWQREAVSQGRHSERLDLMEEEAAAERAVKPKLAALRTLIAEAARPAA